MENLEREAIKTRLDNALRRLFEQDAQPIALDANGRAITHRLALYLQDEFPEWDVDCEYNRKGHGEIKRLNLPSVEITSDDTEAQTVYRISLFTTVKPMTICS